MKINETQRLGAVNPYNKNNGQRVVESSSKKKRDDVQISTEAKEMLQSQQGVLSPERKKQIEELKNQVSTGTYSVDAGKIAEKLLPYLRQQDRN
ncbi:flagellar biosynthesis anti-sigma factor FlgM [Paenibacillus kobensis]|uniref:flagellar biosynthesis anti-sigma factor FlgM n=1 Tax=Paenibacillus kobensis TaxID=59841 RepID=UPI000FD8727A|nr:flagellar biosynthesis anti-sigma factor FlgM [Paenibacillus kobensis]